MKNILIVGCGLIGSSILRRIQKKKITKKRKEKLKKIINLSKDVVAELCFNNTESLYVIKGKMKSDADKKMNFTEIFAGGSNKYYVNLEIKEFFYETDTFGEVINIEMLQKKWKLTQETKKIGDYICYKAIDMDSKNQTTIAWYAPKIPVNYGPKKYFGLPGLILRVEESSFIFESTKIFLNKELIEIVKPSKGKKMTKAQYNTIIRKNSPFKTKN